MLFSFIIPTYNSENYIKKCLDSILLQTYTYYEILVVDDGSTDSTLSICTTYSSKNAQIHTYKTPHNGVSQARNYGLKHASGDYICFLDSDDFILPDYLTILSQSLSKTNADIIIFGYQTIQNEIICNISPKHSGFLSSLEVIPFLFRDEGTNGFLWSKVYSRKLLTNFTFDSELQHCEDLDFNLRLFLQPGISVYFIKNVLYCYNLSNNNSLTSSSKLFTDKQFCYTAAFDKIASLLNTPKTMHLYYQSREKFYSILEYSMYLLLTKDIKEKELIKKLKRNMIHYIPKVLISPYKTPRQKIHYLILALVPKLYATIRLSRKKT